MALNLGLHRFRWVASMSPFDCSRIQIQPATVKVNGVEKTLFFAKSTRPPYDALNAAVHTFRFPEVPFILLPQLPLPNRLDFGIQCDPKCPPRTYHSTSPKAYALSDLAITSATAFLLCITSSGETVCCTVRTLYPFTTFSVVGGTPRLSRYGRRPSAVRYRTFP